MRKTFKNLLVEYGAVAVVVYFAIFFLVWFGFWAAIRFGWELPDSVTGRFKVVANAGTWVVAYFATKVTQPLRIAATLAITPFIAKLYERIASRWKAHAG